jgi:hypothetical protein
MNQGLASVHEARQPCRTGGYRELREDGAMTAEVGNS